MAKSHGREVTFQRNLTDWAVVEDEVRRLADRVAADVVDEGRPAVRIGVKVRYAPFFTTTRSKTLPEPTSDKDDIERAAAEVLSWFERDRPIRLLGVRAEF